MANRQYREYLTRSQSEFDPLCSKTQRAFDVRRLHSRSQDAAFCASPSLSRVIQKNVVQMRRQEFEKISSEKGNSGRQIKSDGCIGSVPGQVAMIQAKHQSSHVGGDSCRLTKPGFRQFKQASLSLSLESSSDLSSTLPRPAKPPVQPKPDGLQRLSIKPCDSDVSPCTPNLKPSPEFQILPCSPDTNDVFYSKDDNNNSHASETDSKSLDRKVSRVHSDAISVPVPPPKPPRSLCNVSPASKTAQKSEFCGYEEGKYDLLANSVSVVMPMCLTELEKPDEIVIPSVKTKPKPVPTYETIKELAPQSLEVKKASKEPQISEVKKTPKMEKGKKWESKLLNLPGIKKNKKHGHSKTVQVDNPGYIYGLIKGADDIIPGRPLVKYLSDNALDRDHDHLATSCRSKKNDDFEDIYAEPYVVPEELSNKSRDRCAGDVSFDADGYAVPSTEDTPVQQNTQSRSRARSKVSHAYAVLRLPNETGDTTHIEDTAADELEDQEKRLIYVKNVRQNTSAAIAKYEQVRLKSAIRLFQYGMIVKLEGSEDDGFKPTIAFCVPKEMQENDLYVCHFCFPDADMLTPQSHFEGENFSFVLTSETGDRRYGWCRRYLPSGSEPRLPEALCIVSTIGECGMYEQLLRTLQEFRLSSEDAANDLIEVAYARPMPLPGKEVYIRTEIPDQGRQTIILKRVQSSSSSAVPFSHLLEHLPVPLLLQVFGAMLLERKLLFCASRLSILSSCISALVALLYPFEWQHTYVTVLPLALIDLVGAPTPFIMGMLTSMKPHLEDHDISEVLFVDLDTGSIVKGVGDESRILPKKIQKAITNVLMDDSDVPIGSSGTLKRRSAIIDSTVKETFLRFFIETCAHYSDFIVQPEDDETTFQRESFVKAVHSRSIRLFLDWFTQTQMFEVFMSGKLSQNATSNGEFDDGIAEYRDEMEKDTKMLQKSKKKAIGKKISEFFRESGDKIKRTFQKKVYV